MYTTTFLPVAKEVNLYLVMAKIPFKMWKLFLLTLMLGFLFLISGYRFSSMIFKKYSLHFGNSSYMTFNRKTLPETRSNTPISRRQMKLLQKQLKQVLQQDSVKKEYIILIWEAMYKTKIDFVIDPMNCGKCRISYDKSEVSHHATKALIFHYNEIRLGRMPRARRKDQLYVWWSKESPPALRNLRGITLNELNGIFNLTMTYRRDSDVYFPYSTAPQVLKFVRNSGTRDPFKDIDEIVTNKTNLAFWVVSNCAQTLGARKRMKISMGLAKAGLDLDAEGACFSMTRLEDIKEVKRYKFYLSFENGYHCRDYITEKFFQNALMYGAVPVVFGPIKSDYLAVAPPNSFIFAEDFGTPSKLVEHLNYLDKNEVAYREYFKWRTMKIEDMPQHDRAIQFCQLCRILHGINVDNVFNPRFDEQYSNIPMFEHPTVPRIVPSIKDFFYKREDRKCLPTF